MPVPGQNPFRVPIDVAAVYHGADAEHREMLRQIMVDFAFVEKQILTSTANVFNLPPSPAGSLLVTTGTNISLLPLSGSDGFVLTKDHTAADGLAWEAIPLTAGGTSGQIQFNSGGLLAGTPNMTYSTNIPGISVHLSNSVGDASLSLTNGGASPSSASITSTYGTIQTGGVTLGIQIKAASGKITSVINSAVGDVGFTVNTIASQTANLQNWQVNSTTKASIDPTGTITVTGLHGRVNAKAANYAVTNSDFFIPVTTAAATITVTFAAAAANAGQLVTVNKVDAGAGHVAWAGVVGAPSNLTTQYQSQQFLSDGTNFYPV